MPDFKTSLMAGIAAARAASTNDAEIKNILSAAAKQIKDVSRGRAKLDIRDFISPPEPPMRFNAGISTRNMAPGLKYTALVISDMNGGHPIEIAKWTQHENGYPCTISFGGQRYLCSSKSELERAISELLKSPATGKAILERISPKR